MSLLSKLSRDVELGYMEILGISLYVLLTQWHLDKQYHYSEICVNKELYRGSSAFNRD